MESGRSCLRPPSNLDSNRSFYGSLYCPYQHEPERCPATDPYLGATLLNYLSRPHVRKHGVSIQGETGVRGEHTQWPASDYDPLHSRKSARCALIPNFAAADLRGPSCFVTRLLLLGSGTGDSHPSDCFRVATIRLVRIENGIFSANEDACSCFRPVQANYSCQSLPALVCRVVKVPPFPSPLVEY